MNKIFLVSSLLAANLLAMSIDFEMAPKNPKRVAPNQSNQILSFSNALEDSMKSVVNISAKKTVSASPKTIPPQMYQDPFFRKFFGDQFGNQVPKNRVQRALGSGVIISKDGYIVTNNHVVSNADEVTVTLSNSPTEYTAKIIGVDADSDLAVIKIEAKKLTPIKIGSSDSLKVGDFVIAIGNPFGIGETATQGIISALNKNKVGINRYENYIQTDASINPGNSGGALVDSRGALIGINSAILSKSGGNNGIGFAIPVNMVKNVVEKLVSDGKVSRGYLGVSIDDLNKEIGKLYNHKYGALILNIGQDTPASKYGIKRGDLIYEINGKKVKDRVDLQNQVASFKPDTKIKLSIERNKKNITLDIVLGNRTALASSLEKKAFKGLDLANITQTLSKQYRLTPGTAGVLIRAVKIKSKAEKVGFQPGDVIIQIEDMEIKNVKDIQKAVEISKNQHKRIYINRYGRVLLLVMK